MKMKFRLLKKSYQFLFSPFSFIFGFLYRCRIVISEVFLSLFILIFYCEMLHYNIVIHQCSWPGLSIYKEDFSVPTTNENLLKIMVLSDLQMECSKNNNRLIFEEETHTGRCFRTAAIYLKPDIVFVLGDVLKEGMQHCPSEELNGTIRRFKQIFYVLKGTQIFVVPENKDLGFHNQMNENESAHFNGALNSSLIQFLTIKKNHFVLLNSMALRNDSSTLCSVVYEKLSKIEKMLNCSTEFNKGKCDSIWTLPVYNRPILIQNYPLFQVQDEECGDYSSASRSFRSRGLMKNHCENAIDKLMRRVNPRIIFSAQKYQDCTRSVPGDKFVEIMIPSFDRRSEKNPAIGLATVTTSNYEVIKCQMPRYSTIVTIYVVGGLIILTWIYYSYKTRRFSIMK